jgi:hypothetical protein
VGDPLMTIMHLIALSMICGTIIAVVAIRTLFKK